MANKQIALHRLEKLSDDFLMTTDEVCAIAGVSASTISTHRHAGLLPFVPGRPIHMRAGDVRVYVKFLSGDGKDRFHRTLRIDFQDRRLYSPLHSVASFTDQANKTTIEAVIKETDALWRKYKMAKEASNPKPQRAKVHRLRAAE